MTATQEYIEVKPGMYKAQAFRLAFGHVEFQMAGTLEGEIDFVMQPNGARYRTVQISLDEAKALYEALGACIADVTNQPGRWV